MNADILMALVSFGETTARNVSALAGYCQACVVLIGSLMCNISFWDQEHCLCLFVFAKTMIGSMF